MSEKKFGNMPVAQISTIPPEVIVVEEPVVERRVAGVEVTLTPMQAHAIAALGFRIGGPTAEGAPRTEFCALAEELRMLGFGYPEVKSYAPEHPGAIYLKVGNE